MPLSKIKCQSNYKVIFSKKIFNTLVHYYNRLSQPNLYSLLHHLFCIEIVPVFIYYFQKGCLLVSSFHGLRFSFAVQCLRFMHLAVSVFLIIHLIHQLLGYPFWGCLFVSFVFRLSYALIKP